MPPFSLTVISFTCSTLPPPPPNLFDLEIRSSLTGSPLAATSPLKINLRLPQAQPSKPALHPATRLQLHYHFPGTGDIYMPEPIISHDLSPINFENNDDDDEEAQDNIFQLTIPPSQIPRAKVNHGQTSTAQVKLHAWKGEKLLGTWNVGQIEGLGLEGLKSGELARRRAEILQQGREEAWEMVEAV